MSADGFDVRLALTSEAEANLLCALLHDNRHFEACADLKDKDFSDAGFGALFAVIAEKVRAGRAASPATLQVWAAKEGFAFDVLVNMHMTGATFPRRLVAEFAGAIKSAAAHRALVDVLSKALDHARNYPHVDAGEQIIKLEKRLGELARASVDGDSFVDLHLIMERAIADAKAGKIKGLSTGIKGLDDLTGGLAKGHFWAIGGYAKQGKSTVSQAIGFAVAQQKKAVLRFDFEMTDEDIGLRYATSIAYQPGRASYAGEPRNPTYIAARKGALDAEQWGWLEDAASMAVDLPIYVLTERGLTAGQMLARARRKIRALEREGIETGAVIVDHTLLVKSETERRGNKAAEAGDVADEITAMAKSLGVCVIGLCQLNRDAAKSEGRPVKSQMAWSANIERNANVIALIHRPASKLEAKEKLSIDDSLELKRTRDHMCLYVDGNRNGPTGEVWCRTNMGSAVLRDAPELAREYQQ